MKTARTITIAAVLLFAGCAGFSGERAVGLRLNILGNTIEWESTCTGEYPTAPESCPIPAPPTE